MDSQGCMHCSNEMALAGDLRCEQEKTKELTRLLAEATQMLFVEAATPSRELYFWFRRRQENSKKKAA